MYIKQIISRSRRDFTALYECAECGYKIVRVGYDDEYFHSKVIPTMGCKGCGAVAGPAYKPMKTKYPDGMLV